MKKIFILALLLPVLAFAQGEPKKEQSLKYTYKDKTYIYEIFRIGENDYKQYRYRQNSTNKTPFIINGKDHYSKELLNKAYEIEIEDMPNTSYTDLDGKKISPQEYYNRLKNLPTLTKKQFEELLPLASSGPSNADTGKDKTKNETITCDLNKTTCSGKSGQSAYVCLYNEKAYPECQTTMTRISKSFNPLKLFCGETVLEKQLCKDPDKPDANNPKNIKNIKDVSLYLCLKKLENNPVLPDDCKQALQKVSKDFDAVALEAFPVKRTTAPSSGVGSR